MTQSVESPRGLPQEEVDGISSEKLDTVRDALRTMARVRQTGWAVA